MDRYGISERCVCVWGGGGGGREGEEGGRSRGSEVISAKISPGWN